MPGARVLVATLKALGCRTVLVTGGFHQFADPVAEMLGFERVVGNRLEVTAGELKAFVKDRRAPYKYPRVIEFVEDLPKTATGKIQRFKLRAL